MKTRVISAICGGMVLGTVLYLGGIWIVITCVLLSLMATYEGLKLTPYTYSKIITYTFVLLFLISAIISPDITRFIYVSVLVIISLIIISSLYVVSDNKEESPYKMLIYSVGIPLYTGFLFSHVLLIYQGTSLPTHIGLKLLLVTIATTFATDTGAYLIGTFFGKIKIAPTISKNKTLEGSIGGFVSGVIIFVLTGSLIGIELTIIQIIFTGAAISLSAQLGDLLESKLKRLSNTKESGVFMPGHGGLLDRIDSLLVTLPISYYIFWTIYLT